MPTGRPSDIALEEHTAVDVKIGVTHSPHQLVVDTSESPEDVASKVQQAMSESGGILELSDKRGRKVIVSGAQISYVEISEGDHRRVGFAIGD